MRKVGETVAGGIEIELPSHGRGLTRCEIVELATGHRIGAPFRLHAIEQHPNITLTAMHVGVGADDIRVPSIALPLFPHRADVDEKDVILLQNGPWLRWRAEHLQGVGSKSNPDAMPAAQQPHSLEDLATWSHGILL